MRPRTRHWFGGLLAALCGACGGGDDDGGGVPVTFTLQAEVRTPSQINLTWSAHPGTAAGYAVERNGAPAFGTIIRGTSVSDGDLDPDTQYCYRVVATAFPVGPVGQSNRVCARTDATAAWRVEAVDAGVLDAGANALALDSANHLHVNLRRADGVVYTTNASGHWSSTIIESAAGRTGDCAIALDSTGAVHAGYSVPSGALRHATNASGAWVVSTIDGAGSSLAIAVDGANRIHASYQSGGVLVHAVNATGTWVRDVLTGFNGAPTAIVIDSAGAAHIAYAASGGTCAVRHATNASGAWVSTVVTASSQQCRPALAVDALDRAHVVYMQGFDLMHATNASGSWIAASVDRLDWIGPPDVSVAVDTAGALHVSYQDQNADLKYATNRSGPWAALYIDARGEVGAGNAVRVDGTGAVHITYLDTGATTLKHATDR